MYIKSLNLLVVLSFLAACASLTTAPPDPTKFDKKSENIFNDKFLQQQVNNETITNAEYLTKIEQEIIIEINMVRTNPPEYARKYLIPLRAYYHKNQLQLPGKKTISTVEGLRALDECIKKLQANKPLLPLSPEEGLTLAARDHVKDKGRKGTTGHTGSDGSTMGTRLNRYGRWHISSGENINYGNDDVRRIVTSLLIDDGVPSRAHRGNLLNDTFRFVGVSFGEHRTYRYMCVIDFAGAYE